MRAIPVPTVKRYEFSGQPIYSFIGGCSYSIGPYPSTCRAYSAPPYTGENYGYFRLYENHRGDVVLRPAVYSKAPLCLFQFENRAVGIEFKPVVDGQIACVAISGTRTGCVFEYAFERLRRRSKSAPHLGVWEKEECYEPSTPAGVEFRTWENRNWWDIVREYVKNSLVDQGEPTGTLTEQGISECVWMAAGVFHDRVYDRVNRLHMTDVVEESADKYTPFNMYNFPSFEACRLASLARVSTQYWEKCEHIAKNILYNREFFVDLTELGDYRVWHNQVGLDTKERKLFGYTVFGTGYSGYPGGMAVLARKLLELSETMDVEYIARDVRPAVDWLLLVQEEDGAFPFTVPTVPAHGDRGYVRPTGPGSRALGGAAEAIRTLIAASKRMRDEKYVDAARRALNLINPEPPYYAFRGFGDLRDGGPYETDATSGVSLANANLDMFELTGEQQYLETASRLAYYVLTWVYWWRTGEFDPRGFVDPMAESFSPHLSVWNTLLASELFSRLCTHDSDSFWLRVAEYLFERATALQNRVTGGVSEAHPFMWIDRATSIGAESALVTWAIADAGLALLGARGECLRHIRPTQPDRGVAPGDHELSITAEVRRPRVDLSPQRLFQHDQTVARRRFDRFAGVLPAAARPVALRYARGFGAKLRTMRHMQMGTRVLKLSRDCEPKDGFTLSIDNDGGEFEVGLQTRNQGRLVKQVLCPVIHFTSRVVSVTVVTRIMDRVRQCDITLEDSSCYRVTFGDRVGSLGVDGVSFEASAVFFDVTLTANWVSGGECRHRFRVRKTA